MSERHTTRRAFLSATIAAAFAPAAAPLATGLTAQTNRAVRRGRLKQSVSRWPYQKIPLPEFCRAVADMGHPGGWVLRNSYTLAETSEFPAYAPGRAPPCPPPTSFQPPPS